MVFKVGHLHLTVITHCPHHLIRSTSWCLGLRPVLYFSFCVLPAWLITVSGTIVVMATESPRPPHRCSENVWFSCGQISYIMALMEALEELLVALQVEGSAVKGMQTI